MKGPELRLAILKYGLVILGSLIFHWLTHSLARSTLLGSLMTLLHGVMILSLGCRLLITVRDVPPEATVTTKDDLFFVVRDAYSPNITPQQVAWYFVKGRLLWNICEDITSPFLWGHIHQKNCSSCQYPQPPNDLPRTTLPSREVFGETPDFAAFQTLVDSVFFFLGGGGGILKIPGTWSSCPLFWGDFGAPPQLGSEVVEENTSRCHFEGFVYLARSFHKKNSHMIYLDM